MIEFHLDGRSGVSPYLQLVQQVRRALRLGLLSEGDQLPTVKDVVGHLAINPNTVLKAYRELEHKGLASGRPGTGTFIEASLTPVSLLSLWVMKNTAMRLRETGLPTSGTNFSVSTFSPSSSVKLQPFSMASRAAGGAG